MRDDHHNNSIVSRPAPWRWPWDRARDVDVGSPTANRVDLGGAPLPPVASVEVAPAPKPRPPGIKPSTPRLEQVSGTTGGPAAWKRLLVSVIVLAALVYHLAPQAARLIGGDQARLILIWLADLVPTVAGFDAGRWLGPGAAAWMWQPILAAGGAGLLRLIALNTARRDPVSALWIAVFALVIDAATWLFMGQKLQGLAFDAAESHALVTLLKVEGAALLAAFFILAPSGKKRLGQTNADLNGVN